MRIVSAVLTAVAIAVLAVAVRALTSTGYNPVLLVVAVGVTVALLARQRPPRPSRRASWR